jgi:hypothetical protein
MSIVTKVLKVSGEATHKGATSPGYGSIKLFPSGTRRFVKKVYLFPHKIDILNEKEKTRVHGSVILEQKASVKKTQDGHHPVDYNTWETTRFVGHYNAAEEYNLKFD